MTRTPIPIRAVVWTAPDRPILALTARLRDRGHTVEQLVLEPDLAIGVLPKPYDIATVEAKVGAALGDEPARRS